MLARHADKGRWVIDEEELRGKLPVEKANLVITTLEENFPDWKETPLKLDGIARSIELGDTVFEMLPNRSVLVVCDSGKDRAKLTSALTENEIGRCETKHNSEHPDDKKRIDMVHLDGVEINKLLQDSDDSTWLPYAEMIEKENISESEAIFRWLNDMNKPDNGVDPKIAPAESARRYRQLVHLVHANNKGIESGVPVVLLGVGHSGSLGQVKYEEGLVTSADDTPKFAEIFVFDEFANLNETKEVVI